MEVESVIQGSIFAIGHAGIPRGLQCYVMSLRENPYALPGLGRDAVQREGLVLNIRIGSIPQTARKMAETQAMFLSWHQGGGMSVMNHCVKQHSGFTFVLRSMALITFCVPVVVS